ncbi:MAG: hypothetical protein FD181_981 [Prolixibacteraceae bacterium]|nr:MAG: hypothetical protein FD181_981 [Prolixibacteraceae bacterium]
MSSNIEGKATGSISFGLHRFDVSLDLIIFMEDDTHIVYCPPLEVYGYGNNENEAQESFKIALAEFFKYSTNKSTLKLELKRLGWQLKKSKTKPMVPPPITELLSNNENLSRIYNNFDFRKTATLVSIPSVA